jgi:hypothetical protein
MTERRLRVLTFDARLLGGLVLEGATVRIVEGAPPDARLLNVSYDWATDTIQLLLTHPSWEDVEEGVMAPQFCARMEIVERAPERPLRGIILRDLVTR